MSLESAKRFVHEEAVHDRPQLRHRVGIETAKCTHGARRRQSSAVNYGGFRSGLKSRIQMAAEGPRTALDAMGGSDLEEGEGECAQGFWRGI